MAWILFGKYPTPPEWEKPIIKQMMRNAVDGDDSALKWLKQRFPPSQGLV
jgi:hypothetical protein